MTKKTLEWSQLKTGLEREVQRILTAEAQAASDDILKYSEKITVLMSAAISQGRKDISEELILQAKSIAAMHHIRMSDQVSGMVTSFIGQTIRILAIALV